MKEGSYPLPKKKVNDELQNIFQCKMSLTIQVKRNIKEIFFPTIIDSSIEI